MKITKTQLKEIIKEELETVLSEEDIEEGVLSKAFHKVRRGLGHRTGDEMSAEYREKQVDAWEALDHQEKVAALRKQSDYNYLYIPAEVRDAWEEDQKIIDAEKRNVAIRRSREEEEAQKRGSRADADRDFEEREKAKKKTWRDPGRKAPEWGQGSAPWDE